MTKPNHSHDFQPRPDRDRPEQIRAKHLAKLAIVYVRQSSADQVRHNTGSTAAQRDLADLPREWGWPDSRILVVDDDLGLSGTSCTDRTGFKKMLDLIDGGHVGIVIVRDVSRLSRDPLDAERFLSKAIRAGVLIEAQGRLFDAASEDLAALFAVRVQSLLAWYENGVRVQNLRAAKLAKVRQGYAVTRPPIGYVQSVRGKWIKDPDPVVQRAVRLVIDLYLRTNSIGKVVKYMREHNLLFPRRIRGEIVWEPIARHQAWQILRNPQYTGDYAFQRYKVIPGSEHQRRRVEPRHSTDVVTYSSLDFHGAISC